MVKILNVINELGHPPNWLVSNVVYLTIMGSQAYGVSTDNSDFDVYGVCIPPKRYIFPHLYGYIQGFGPNPPRFDQWQEHHLYDPNKKREYDFTVYNIVRYFKLVSDMNPNMVDSLFTPVSCVLTTTQVGELIRTNRHHFLSKKLWFTFRGYAYSQLKKLQNKKSESGKRHERIKEHGYDVKNAYNVVRLLLEAEQLLTLGDLDLQRDRQLLRAIRNGEWTLERVIEFFENKERHLQNSLDKSALPNVPNYSHLKELLLQCLEIHYGSLDHAIVVPDRYEQALLKIDNILNKVIR